MINEELFNELLKIERIIGQGLDDSQDIIGLSRTDNVKIVSFRDSVVFSLALLRRLKIDILKKGGKSYETKTKKK